MKIAAMAIAMALGTACVLGTSQTGAAEIKLIAGGPFKEPFLELLPAFERSHQHKVTVNWLGGPQVLERLKANETTDAVILTVSAADELTKLGKLRDPVNLVTSRVGVAVRAGAPHPEIGSAEALAKTLRAAKSVAHSSGTSGAAVVALFQRLGVADDVKGKVKQIQGEPVGVVVARGEAEIGFQQMSELLPVKGIDVVGPLPSIVEPPIELVIATHVVAKDITATKELVKFLTSADSIQVLKKYGLDSP